MKLKRLIGKLICAFRGHSDVQYMYIDGVYRFRGSLGSRRSSMHLKRRVNYCCDRCGKVLKRKPLRARELAFFSRQVYD